jgi:hypothetical protein
MFHEKRLIEGVVSRTPIEAYNLIQGDVFWERLLENEDIDTTLVDVSRHLVYLAEENTRYVIVHRHLLTEDQVTRWLDYFIITPLYKDDLIVVYPTRPEAGRDFALMWELGGGIGLIDATLSTTVLPQDGLLETDLRWGSQAAPTQDWIARLALVSPTGETVQTVDVEPCTDWPTSQWGDNAVARGQAALRIDPFIEGGVYTVTLGLVNQVSGEEAGKPATLGQIEVQAVARTFDVPEMDVSLDATFGDVLQLLGYDLHQEDDVLTLTLHWQALRRMDVAYKMFIHLLDPESGELVAQTDVMPRNWGYPTHWWEVDEVVSDQILVSLAGAKPGTYRLGVGVYDPDAMERLPTDQGSDHVLLEMVDIPGGERQEVRP